VKYQTGEVQNYDGLLVDPGGGIQDVRSLELQAGLESSTKGHDFGRRRRCQRSTSMCHLFCVVAFWEVRNDVAEVVSSVDELVVDTELLQHYKK